MKRTAFLLDVTDEDAPDVWFDVDGGRVVAFSVNDRALVQGEWHEVIRYDTSHGQLNVHEFWPRGTERIVAVGAAPTVDYTQAFDSAMRDVDENWKNYRAKLEATK